MNENILDALLFMLDHADEQETANFDREKMLALLDSVGFSQTQVNKAFSWLDGLAYLTEEASFDEASYGSFRFYTEEEKAILDTDCQGFLFALEQIGVIDNLSREIIIDRAMALHDDSPMDLGSLKWMTMFILMNLPDKESEIAWVEKWDQHHRLH